MVEYGELTCEVIFIVINIELDSIYFSRVIEIAIIIRVGYFCFYKIGTEHDWMILIIIPPPQINTSVAFRV